MIIIKFTNKTLEGLTVANKYLVDIFTNILKLTKIIHFCIFIILFL